MTDQTQSPDAPFVLSACAEMLWRDRPMEWRLRRLTELGFQAGIWNWQGHELAMLKKSGATFSSMTGYKSLKFSYH